MARTVELTTEQFREKLHGERAFYLPSENRFGSPNLRAQYDENVRNKEPGAEPLPWEIPSAMYYGKSGDYGISALQNTPIEEREKPDYIISGVQNWMMIGGGQTYNPDTKEYDVNFREFPCSIYIRDCTFKVGLEFTYVKSRYKIVFENCIFEQHFIFKESECDTLSFSNCQFLNIYTEFSHAIINNLEINKSNLNIVNINAKEKLILKKIVITDSNSTELNLIGREFGDILLNNFDCKKYNIKAPENDTKPTHIDFFDLILGDSNKSVLIFDRVDFFTISLRGILKSNTLIFQNITFFNFYIHQFSNEGKVLFHNINPIKMNFDLPYVGKVGIIGSQLGKAEFNYVNFRKLYSCQIYLSNMTEVTFTNTDFPPTIVGRDALDFYGIRESYRQLKFAASKQGDVIRQLRYEQLEMKAYEQLLEDGRSNWKDKFILKTNRWSNNHGQDWLRAICILGGISFIFYILIKLCLGYHYFNPELIFSEIANFLNFTLNPLHKLTELFDDAFKNPKNVFLAGLAQFIDVIARGFSGYMLFQFLRAFRKYSK